MSLGALQPEGLAQGGEFLVKGGQGSRRFAEPLVPPEVFQPLRAGAAWWWTSATTAAAS